MSICDCGVPPGSGAAHLSTCRSLRDGLRNAIELYRYPTNRACFACWEGDHEHCRNPDKPMLPADDEQGYGSGHECPCRFALCGDRALEYLRNQVPGPRP